MYSCACLRACLCFLGISTECQVLRLFPDLVGMCQHKPSSAPHLATCLYTVVYKVFILTHELKHASQFGVMSRVACGWSECRSVFMWEERLWSAARFSWTSRTHCVMRTATHVLRACSLIVFYSSLRMCFTLLLFVWVGHNSQSSV